MPASCQQCIDILEGIILGIGKDQKDYNRNATFPLNTNNFDEATYYFEVNAYNNGAADAVIALVCGETEEVTLTVPASTAAFTRIRSASFNPTSGDNWHFVRIKGAANNNGAIYSARLIINQVDATKTVVYVPLNSQYASGPSTQESLASNGSFSGTSYVYPVDQKFAITKREDSNFSTIADYTFQSSLGLSGTGATAYMILANVTDGTTVAASELTSTVNIGSNMPEHVSVVLDGTEENFHDGDDYSIKVKMSATGKTGYYWNTWLLIRLTNLLKGQTYYRTSYYTSFAASANFFYNRMKWEASLFSGVPVKYFEVTGKESSSGTVQAYLSDYGADDDNTTGTNITPGCVTNGTTMIRVRSATEIALTDENRYGLNVVRSTGTMVVTRSILLVKWVGTAAGSTFIPKVIMF